VTIGEFDRRAIAAAVRATAAADHTGSPCVRAARAGRAALAEAGIEAVIATGTLVYRASVRDVLCVAHAWLEAGGDLIDSVVVAGWRRLATWSGSRVARLLRPSGSPRPCTSGRRAPACGGLCWSSRQSARLTTARPATGFVANNQGVPPALPGWQ